MNTELLKTVNQLLEVESEITKHKYEIRDLEYKREEIKAELIYLTTKEMLENE